MRSFQEALQWVAASFTPESATAFRLFGRLYEADDDETTLRAAVLGPTAQSLLVETLYAVLHCREPVDGVNPSDVRAGRDALSARALVDALSAANAGRGPWQSGWTAGSGDSGEAGRVSVERFGVRFTAPAAHCRPAGATAGTRVQVRVPREYQRLVTGFYMALGDADDEIEWETAVRVYWHVGVDGAVPLMANLTGLFNQRGVPFRFKVLSDPRSYVRADSAVLYLTRGAYERARSLVGQIYRQVAHFLRSELSPFVKPLAQGLGVAEDPGSEVSFGQHRCRLLAAIVCTQAFVVAPPHERVALVLAGLAQQGFDPEAIYLRPGSVDIYEPVA